MPSLARRGKSRDTLTRLVKSIFKVVARETRLKKQQAKGAVCISTPRLCTTK